MPGPSRLANTIAVLSIALLLAGPFPAGFANAGTTFHEGPKDFSAGQRENLNLRPEGLSLSMSNGPLLNNWTEWTPTFSPTPRSYPAMAYDSRHGEVVLFGGECQGGTLNDTWTYNLTTNSWKLMAPATAPSARQACGMAYDAAHGKLVLFGGYSNFDYLDDTWTYDLETNIWERKNPQTSPPSRGNFGLAYDSAEELVVLFGGFNRHYLCDTWTYDAGKDTWFELGLANTPSGRSDFAMAIDGERNEVVVFGGYISGYFLNDTWSYNFTENDWTDRNPAPAPSPRAGISMVYDSALRQMVLFGSYNSSSYSTNETWTYDPGANIWTECDPMTAPPARVYYGMAFDGGNNKAILFGGGYNIMLGDTWSYDATDNIWAFMCPSSVPPPREEHAMAYDGAHGVAVLFGGFNGYSIPLNDTWTFNLSTNRWIEMNPPAAPPGRYSHSMVYDSAHDKVLLFGGFDGDRLLNDTWTYDPATNNWTKMSPPAAPSSRADHAMVFDSVQDQAVLFGGGPGGEFDTWTYNLSVNNWTNMKPQKQPPGRMGPAMAFDPAHDKVVLFGGTAYNMLNDTWTYDPATNKWADMDPPVTPQARGYSAMAWDDSSQKAVLFGGWNGGSIPDNCYNDTWSYDIVTNRWTNLDPVAAPSPRFHYAMVHDDNQGRMVLFGGVPSNGFSSETWTYGAGESNGPGCFTSSPRDTGGTAYLGKISWDADVPENTSLRFQFRAAGSPFDLALKPFTGPDGTSGSFYDIPGQKINSQADGARWFQYRAYFSTDDVSATPLLREITIDYNLLQELAVISPAGGENWTGLQTIAWSAFDRDHDALSFDIFLDGGSISIPIAQKLSDATRSFPLNASLLPDGTYRVRIIARDDDPSIPLTTSALSGNFTIYNTPPPPPNHPPHVWLVSPLNNSVVNSTSVRLMWLGTDPDGDPLNYTVYYSNLPLSEVSYSSQVTQDGWFFLANLADNSTYYWTVDASDGHSGSTDVPAGEWRFTVRLHSPPPSNHPPEITSSPPRNATEGEQYAYNVTAFDPDNDPLTYSLGSPVQGMAIDPISGRLTWTPASAQVFFILVIVSDGFGGTDNQTFYLTVQRSTPICVITSPVDGTKVSGTINITGIAIQGARPLQKVEVRIDGAGWTPAERLENWSLSLDTRTLANGRHIIQARAYDGRYSSENATVSVTVDNGGPKPPRPENVTVAENICPWIILVVIILIIGGFAVIYNRTRKSG